MSGEAVGTLLGPIARILKVLTIRALRMSKLTFSYVFACSVVFCKIQDFSNKSLDLLDDAPGTPYFSVLDFKPKQAEGGAHICCIIIHQMTFCFIM